MGFHGLEIGRSALNAANYGIKVAGQNLANMNTTGYTRQVLNQSGSAYGARYAGVGTAQVGSGVNIINITRVSSNMVEKNLRQAASSDSYYSNLNTCYSKIQSYLNEPNENTLGNSMTDFWNSMKDLSAHVETLGSRTTTLQDAISLATNFSDTAVQLRTYRMDLNSEVADAVGQINQMLEKIAILNRSIVDMESGGITGVVANDLRDERGEILRQLSEYVDIDVVEEKEGSVSVSVAGRHMVYFDQVYAMDIKQEKIGDLNCNIPVFARDNYPINLREGKLAALVESRDVVLKSYIEDIDQLAGAFTWEFNRIYSQNRGDDSFDSMTSLYTPTDPAVTLDKLNFRTNIPKGTFQIQNGNLEMIIHNRNTGKEESVTVEIDLDGRLGPGGEPDMILHDPANPGAEHSLVNRLQKALDDKLPGGFKVTIDNQYRISIESTSTDYGFAFGEDTSGVLVALGMNVLFTGHDAASMGVNQDVIDDPSRMAVSKSFEAGDNEGILSLISFGEDPLPRLGGKSPFEHYTNMAGRFGGEFYRVSTMAKVKSDLHAAMFNHREELSGVSETEETLKLLAYQRAFQSASKYLGIVDQLYETLINL